MIWLEDKKIHYRTGYKYSKKYPIIGFIGILFAAPIKEVWDFIRKLFGQNHTPDWLDIWAGYLGAWDGLLKKTNKW